MSAPLLLRVDVSGRAVLVVGAGRAGREKIDRLAAAGAHVRVVDPGLDGEPLGVGVEVLARPFDAVDVQGMWLVVAATGIPDVDAAVQAAADEAGIWVARADRSDGGGVSFAATLDRSPVTIGVATGGASPALARWLRDRIASVVPAEVGALARLLADRPRTAGHRHHRGLPLDDALDALVAGDEVRARRLLSDQRPTD